MSASTPRPGPRVALAVIAFGVFVAADDLTVVTTMLRPIIFDLGIPLPDGLDQAAWIVNAYLIAYVVVMPFMGRVSDIVGRRAVYMAAMGLFLAGSIWVPLAETLPTFLVGRVLTALGGGAMVPIGMAIIGDLYPPERRASAMGTLGAVDTAGWVWGPLYGALLVRFLSWRWQFYLNVPLSILGIAAAWWALRDLPPPARRARLDWAGAGLLTASLLALCLALLGGNRIQTVGTLTELEASLPAVAGPLYAVAALALLAFAWIERRHPEPLIEPSLLRRPNFAVAGLVNFLIGAVLVIAMVNVPLFVNVLEVDLARAAVRSGWLLSALTLSMAVSAYAGGQAVARWGYRPVAAAGIALCAAAFAWIGALWTPAVAYGPMAGQLAVLGVGFGLVTAPIGTAAIDTAPLPQRGIAAGLVIVWRLLGMSVGLAGLTAWGIARFNTLRTQVALPALTDPGFAAALTQGLIDTTARVLAETFLLSAGLAVFALLVAWRLRPLAPTDHSTSALETGRHERPV